MTVTRSDYRVSVPEGADGGAVVRRFEVPEDSLENLRLAMRGGRQTRPGWYTQIVVDGTLWMSDTDAEVSDHLGVIGTIRWGRLGQRVLIHGLGLGVVVGAAIQSGRVAHLDVVELDPRVIRLVGPHYEAMAAEAGVELVIHEGDAYTYEWPKGVRWDVVWHDIWPDMCTDYLDDMARLHRRFGRRSTWQGSWGRIEMLAARRIEKARGW